MSEMFMLFPGGKDKARTLSYDDGVQTEDIWHAANMEIFSYIEAYKKIEPAQTRNAG